MSKHLRSNAIAYLALFVGLGGVSYAAVDLARNSVTSKHVKNGSLKSKDLAKGVRSALAKAGTRGPAGPTGPAGPAGVTGPQGQPGAAGARGFSAWDTIPSGQTLTGVEYFKLYNPDSTSTRVWNVNFPARIPTQVAGNEINFAADGTGVTVDDDAACTGTYDEPTAPAGKVCLYRGTANGVTSIYGSGWDPAHRTRAFYVEYIPVANTTIEVVFSWAYTAP